MFEAAWARCLGTPRNTFAESGTLRAISSLFCAAFGCVRERTACEAHNVDRVSATFLLRQRKRLTILQLETYFGNGRGWSCLIHQAGIRYGKRRHIGEQESPPGNGCGTRILQQELTLPGTATPGCYSTFPLHATRRCCGERHWRLWSPAVLAPNFTRHTHIPTLKMKTPNAK